MTDTPDFVAEALLEVANELANAGFTEHPTTVRRAAATLTAQAAEIERLTKEAILESQTMVAYRARAEAAEAKRDRLRDALRQAAQRCNESGPAPLGERETIYAVHRIVVAALSPQEPGNG